jgi:hypothetical protein
MRTSLLPILFAKYGPNLIDNTGFDSASGWATSGAAYWSIGSGVATLSATTTTVANLDNTDAYSKVIAGRQYEVTFDYVNVSGSPSNRLYVRGTTTTFTTTTGSKRIVITAGSSTAGYSVRFESSAIGSCTIDNVRLRTIIGS